MPRLPVISGEKLIKYLNKTRGFWVKRAKGSHAIIKSSDEKITFTVPLHRELKKGTLEGILSRAGIPEDVFIQEWERYM